MKLFLDTNVFLLAIGGAHPERDACRTLLTRLGNGSLRATTSTEVVQELLYVLRRRGRHEAALRVARELLHLFPDLLPVTARVMDRTCAIAEAHPHVPTRDAVHAATMQVHGLAVVVSTDPHFDAVSGITRLSPSQGVL